MKMKLMSGRLKSACLPSVLFIIYTESSTQISLSCCHFEHPDDGANQQIVVLFNSISSPSFVEGEYGLMNKSVKHILLTLRTYSMCAYTFTVGFLPHVIWLILFLLPCICLPSSDRKK